MATGVRVAITLACTECKRRNYQTQKSKRNSPDRVEFKKYCRWCNQHTVHREPALAGGPPQRPPTARPTAQGDSEPRRPHAAAGGGEERHVPGSGLINFVQ